MEPVRVGIRQEPIIGESFSSVNHKYAGFDITLLFHISFNFKPNDNVKPND